MNEAQRTSGHRCGISTLFHAGGVSQIPPSLWNSEDNHVDDFGTSTLRFWMWMMTVRSCSAMLWVPHWTTRMNYNNQTAWLVRHLPTILIYHFPYTFDDALSKRDDDDCLKSFDVFFGRGGPGWSPANAEEVEMSNDCVWWVDEMSCPIMLSRIYVPRRPHQFSQDSGLTSYAIVLTLKVWLPFWSSYISRSLIVMLMLYISVPMLSLILSLRVLIWIMTRTISFTTLTIRMLTHLPHHLVQFWVTSTPPSPTLKSTTLW